MINVNALNNNYKSYVYEARSRSKAEKNSPRNELAKLLFGRSMPSKADIAFGWSKNVSEKEVEILEALTDPALKNVLVVSHSRPDGDAYGSNIGICGILESMGVRAYPVIDDRPLTGYEKLHSARKGVPAGQFLKRPRAIEQQIHDNGLKQFDLAVITDCSVPNRITEDVFSLIAKAKKLILIDHHKDQPEKATNEAQWLEKIQTINPDLSPDKIIYWRDAGSSSASEMVAEMDYELATENKNQFKGITEKEDWFDKYNFKAYHEYRLALAAGILSDTSTKPPEDRSIPEFSRTGNKEVTIENNTPENATVAYYRWLVNKSGAQKVNMMAKTRKKLPGKLYNVAEDIVKRRVNINGIQIKSASEKYPIQVMYISDPFALGRIAKMVSNRSMRVDNSDVYQRLKAASRARFHKNNNALTGLVASYSDRDKAFGLSINTKEALAVKIVDALEKAGIGEGGGHDDACGFKSFHGKTFEEALTVIEQVVFDHIKAQEEAEKEETKVVELIPEDLPPAANEDNIREINPPAYKQACFMGKKINLSA